MNTITTIESEAGAMLVAGLLGILAGGNIGQRIDIRRYSQVITPQARNILQLDEKILERCDTQYNYSGEDLYRLRVERETQLHEQNAVEEYSTALKVYNPMTKRYREGPWAVGLACAGFFIGAGCTAFLLSKFEQ